MAEEKRQEEDLDVGKKNGADVDEDDHDLFKSAMESPMTDTDRTIHGEDEIDLNDDDDFDDSSSPSGMNDVPGSMSDISPVRAAAVTGNHFGNHVEKQSVDSPKNASTNGTSSPTEIKEPYRSEEPNTKQNSDTAGVRSDVDDNQEVTDKFDTDPNQFLEVTVTDPQKQGDGMSSFLMYRVTTRTNIALFRRKEFAVWRRFSDFLGLHSKIADKYLKKGRIVPHAPDKDVIGTTKIKISGQSENSATGGGGGHNSNQAGDFVEKRRNTLQRFLNRIAVHPMLRIDPDFRDFLEIDSDLPKSSSTSALSGAGVARFFSKVGETMSKISYKMDENDPWFEEKVQNVDALENQLRKVHNSVELLFANRKELAMATGIFAKSTAILSNAEEHTGLARAMAQLADVEDKVEQIHNEQANLDFFLLSELLKEYLGLIGSVKEVFHERVKAYQAWQHAQQTLNKKRELKAKLELQVRNDKIAQAREEVVEWEGKVESTQEEFEAISKVIKKELETFEAARVTDFKKSVIQYLESLMNHQQELVKYWEVFLPEAKAVV